MNLLLTSVNTKTDFIGNYIPYSSKVSREKKLLHKNNICSQKIFRFLFLEQNIVTILLSNCLYVIKNFITEYCDLFMMLLKKCRENNSM
jgi:hypothetical protein